MSSCLYSKSQGPFDLRSSRGGRRAGAQRKAHLVRNSVYQPLELPKQRKLQLSTGMILSKRISNPIILSAEVKLLTVWTQCVEHKKLLSEQRNPRVLSCFFGGEINLSVAKLLQK